MESSFPGSARSAKRPYHQQHPQESPAPFVVAGAHALLFDDDTLAAFINSPAALLPWNGDQSLLIDRYDVRHLLQDLSSIRKRRPAPPLTDCTEEELNHERFRDLQDALSALPAEDQQASEDLSTQSAGGYQAVPFSYSEEAIENGTQPGSTHRSAGFRPPFHVPDALKLYSCASVWLAFVEKLEDRYADDFFFVCGSQPPSEKLHQIMVGTAKFVKEHGGQSEFLLKVKQGSNPMFGFLNVDHQLYKYYRFLMEHPELLQPVSQKILKPEETTHETGEGLSLLGFAYGSGDEDDDKVLRLESRQASLDAIVLSQERLIASNGGGPSVEKVGSISTQGKAIAATAHTPKVGEESQPIFNESAPRALSLINKKMKGLAGHKEFIQPNKKIVSPLMASESPRKEGSDAVLRLPQKPESKTSSWHSVPSSKDLDYGMSADAAAAVVLAATRGARGLKQDSSNNNKSSSSSGLSQKAIEANRQSSAVGVRKSSSLLGLGQTDVRLAKAVAEAAAIAASHEADSADALLTPAEKLKAERLRKAKMFAAMIKSGKNVSGSGEKPSEQLPAAVSTKSDDVRTDSFPGLAVNGQAVPNGRAVSGEVKPQIEEVEDSDVNKSVRAESIDLMNKRSSKERVYRKRESKEHHKLKGERSDSDESEHRGKRRSHRDHGVDGKKRRHSRRKKRRTYDSESADSECSSGSEGKDRYSSKSHRRHHHRRKRSHHEKDESQEGEQRPSRHKVRDDDDLDTDLQDKKQRHRKSQERGSSSSSEDEVPQNVKGSREAKAVKGEGEHLVSPVLSKQSMGADVVARSVVTTEVPAEIRAKVRAMLLSTL